MTDFTFLNPQFTIILQLSFIGRAVLKASEMLNTECKVLNTSEGGI